MTVKDTRKMVAVSLFIALDVLLTRFLSYDSPTVRIGFAFVPVALCAAWYGPVVGGAAAAMADVLGMMLFPRGPYFPGFTLSAFLSGAVYGVFLYKKPETLARVAAAAAVVCLVINLGLDTLWIHMLYGKAILAMLPGRFIKAAVMLPIQTVVLKTVLYGLRAVRNYE